MLLAAFLIPVCWVVAFFALLTAVPAALEPAQAEQGPWLLVCGLGAQHPWIGGIAVEGEAIMPRTPAAMAYVRKRAGRFYLYSGVPAVAIGIRAAIVKAGMRLGLVERGENWAMEAYQWSLIPMFVTYGLWSLRRYRVLRSENPPASADEGADAK